MAVRVIPCWAQGARKPSVLNAVPAAISKAALQHKELGTLRTRSGEDGCEPGRRSSYITHLCFNLLVFDTRCFRRCL